MALQKKLWKQHNAVRPALLGLDQLAADRAWIAKCVADRQCERLQIASLHVYQASVQGFAAYAATSFS